MPLLIAAYFYDDCSYAMDSFILTLVCIHVANFVVVPALYVVMQNKVRHFSSSIVVKTTTMVRNSVIFENSEEKERLMVKQIYEGTNDLYGSIECPDC